MHSENNTNTQFETVFKILTIIHEQILHSYLIISKELGLMQQLKKEYHLIHLESSII